MPRSQWNGPCADGSPVVCEPAPQPPEDRLLQDKQHFQKGGQYPKDLFSHAYFLDSVASRGHQTGAAGKRQPCLPRP